MSQVFLPNLLFEEELAGSSRAVSRASRRMAAELGPVMGLLPGPDGGDDCMVLVDPEFVPQGLPKALEHVRFETVDALQARTGSDAPIAGFFPWGWSPQAIHTGHQLGLSFAFPPPDIVRCINSRPFSAAFDRCFPVAGDASPELFGRVCASMTEVDEALAEFFQADVTGWVIKAELSHAARNRLLGQQSAPDEKQRTWLRQRFGSGEIVYVEPWVERLAECGLQFRVSPPNEAGPLIQFDGAAEMLTDAVGRYRGSILQSIETDPWWKPAVPHCHRAAERAQTLGFFGVMGMDCMVFRHPRDGRPWLRVCHDINGRCTMGRVALSLKRYLRSGEIGYWCHAPAEAFPDWHDGMGSPPESGGPASEKSVTTDGNPFDPGDRENVRIVQTSPFRVGSQPAKTRTMLLISEDRCRLDQVARKILEQDIRGPFRSQ